MKPKAHENHESGLAGQVTARAEWPGVPVADDEGRIISGALGKEKTILLANHGLLAAGASVEEATYLAVFFERAARMQLRAMAAGGTFAYWARRSG